MDTPQTKYAKTVDGVHIAYQVRGEGPVDLVMIPGFAGNFEIDLEEPRNARFMERLSSFSRVILFDKRGTGLSDRSQTPDLEMRADDLRAVLDAVRPAGVEIRAGVHTGEVELEGAELRGIAVHVGARVADLANGSEILVSRTVRDLTADSGLTFEDAGEHELKGVPDRWHLYRVVT